MDPSGSYSDFLLIPVLHEASLIVTSSGCSCRWTIVTASTASPISGSPFVMPSLSVRHRVRYYCLPCQSLAIYDRKTSSLYLSKMESTWPSKLTPIQELRQIFPSVIQIPFCTRYLHFLVTLRLHAYHWRPGSRARPAPQCCHWFALRCI